MIFSIPVWVLWTIGLIIGIIGTTVNDDGNFAGIETAITIMFFLMIWGASLIVYFIMR